MLILKLIILSLGVAFTLFGYYIYFRKKYSLINGFEADYKAGRKTKVYARRVGLIEFVIGVILLFIGIILVLYPVLHRLFLSLAK